MTALVKLTELIRLRTGISLSDDRDLGSLERFVSARIGALGLKSTAEYLHLLSLQEPSGLELAHLITAVTNPHTYFFRDGSQFFGARALLKKWKESGASRPFKVWSAGCATGEEPFTIAMIALELGIRVQIYATDINDDVLSFAREGRYKAWSLRRCPPNHMKRFFVAEDDESYRVSEEVRDLISFQRHNLVVEPFIAPPDGGGWDWIFCRNVLLYFDREMVEQIIRRFATVLAKEGWLFLSSAEHLHGLTTPFQIVSLKRSFAYRLADESGGARALLPIDDEPSGVFDWRPTLEAMRLAYRPPPSVPPPPSLTSSRITPVFEDLAPPAPESQDKQAVEAANRGELVEARELLSHHLERHPGDHAAWITRGNLCLRLHDFEAALKDYERARERDPLLAEVHYLQGVVYRKLGDHQRAIHALRHALFLDPGHWVASFLLAGLFDREGDEVQQRRNLSHALSLLESGAPAPAFLSHVEGMQDVRLEPAATLQLCRRYLSELGA